jgi:hypothetical protein
MKLATILLLMAISAIAQTKQLPQVIRFGGVTPVPYGGPL